MDHVGLWVRIPCSRIKPFPKGIDFTSFLTSCPKGLCIRNALWQLPFLRSASVHEIRARQSSAAVGEDCQLRASQSVFCDVLGARIYPKSGKQ